MNQLENKAQFFEGNMYNRLLFHFKPFMTIQGHSAVQKIEIHRNFSKHLYIFLSINFILFHTFVRKICFMSEMLLHIVQTSLIQNVSIHTLNSLISTQQILFFLRKFSHLLTCLIRTYTFIFFQGKSLPTRLLEYLCLLILAEIPNYKIILSSFKLSSFCF